MASPIDTTYAIVRETVPGTTPATTAFKNLDYISGSDLTFDGKVVTSDVMLRNRENAAAALMNNVVGGGLKTHARRDTTADILIEGAIGGAFAIGVAKAGNADFSHTIEKVLVEKSTGTAVNSYFRYTGVQVSKFALTVDASSNAEFSFDFVGMNCVESESAIVGATTTAATQGLTLTGNDVGEISIGGLTGIFTSLDFSVEQAKEGIFGLGSAAAVAVGTSPSPRAVKLTAKLLRNGIAANALKNTVVPVSFTIGTGTGNRYTISMSRAMVTMVSDEVSGAAAIVSVEFVALNDEALGTGLTITKS